MKMKLQEFDKILNYANDEYLDYINKNIIGLDDFTLKVKYKFHKILWMKIKRWIKSKLRIKNSIKVAFDGDDFAGAYLTIYPKEVKVLTNASDNSSIKKLYKKWEISKIININDNRPKKRKQQQKRRINPVQIHI